MYRYLSKNILFYVILLSFFAIVTFLIPNSYAQIEYRSAPQEEYRDVWKNGEYEHAIEMINELMEARPELEQVRAYRYVLWLSDRSALHFQIGNVDEAIRDLETATDIAPEPVFMLRLAELYDYRGRKGEYKNILEQATQTNNRRWRIFSTEENFVALGRIMELNGENPKMLLSTLYTSVMNNVPHFAGGFVAAGDLAYRKGAYDLAEKYYQQALNIDGVNADALAGLAETYWKSSDSRLVEILTPLLDLYPNNPRAIAIQIEQFLDLGEAEKALDLIEPVLDMNPHHLHFRALKAAAYFLLDDLEAMKSLQEETLEFNPYCSEVFRIPARIASRHYRFEEAVQLGRKALKTDAEDHVARAMYARDLLRLGKEEEGRKELEQAFKANPYDVHVFNMLNLLDSLETFDRMQETPFVIRLPANESRILADDALRLLQEAYDLYSKEYDIEFEEPVHVQIFDNHDDFMVRSVGLPGSIGFMGICFGHLVTMDSPSARPKHTMNWRSVLWHEFVHVITLQKTKNRMPRWLSEGISVFEEYAFSPACGQKLDLEYKPILESEPLPAITDMETYFIQPKSSSHLMLGYFLSSEFVKFYVGHHGIRSLVNALEQIGEGKDAVPALLKACQQTEKEFNREFHLFLEERLKVLENLPDIQQEKNPISELWDRLTGQEPEIEAWIQKSSPFTDALRKGSQALKDERWVEAEQELKKAHELFPDYTADNAPLQQLIVLYEQWEKEEKLKKVLKEEIAWNSTDYSACKKLIELLQKENDWDEIIRVAQWALGIDPFDAEMRKILLDAYINRNKYSEALTVSRQLMQLDTARRTTYQCNQIELLIELDRFPDAKQETVVLLEEYPHYWEAQKLLLDIVERDDE